MNDSTIAPPNARTFEHEGCLWKPKTGATAAFEDLLAARVLFLQLHRDAMWNPWVLDDRSVELNQAMKLMEQWTRAEQGHRYLTEKELEAELAEVGRESDARFAADDLRRERNRERYDPHRERVRLSLLERQSRLSYDLNEVEELRSGRRFPAMDAARRANRVNELEASIKTNRSEVERLSEVVGDPEDVVDERGWSPADRRDLMLTLYRARRSTEVRALRTRVPELAVAVKASNEKNDRATRRRELEQATRRLEKLLAVPQLAPNDMCSECATPAERHGWSSPPSDGPCPAWPGWAARLESARQMLETFARDHRQNDPPPAKPKPLAVVPSGLPIAEVIERLTEIRVQHPGGEVRRGRANRWEVWPIDRQA